MQEVNQSTEFENILLKANLLERYFVKIFPHNHSSYTPHRLAKAAELFKIGIYDIFWLGKLNLKHLNPQKEKEKN